VDIEDKRAVSVIRQRPAAIVLLALVPLMVGLVLYLLFGHRLVSAMYHGTSIPVLSNIIEQQEHVSLIHYLKKADALGILVGFCYIVLLIAGAGYWFGRKKPFVRRVFGVFFYVVFLAVIAELSARVFFWISRIDIDIYRNYSFRAVDNLLVSDRELGFKLAPSDRCFAVCSDFEVLYETNELGLREKPIKPSADFRILFLGDSVTFGWGVPYGSRFTERVGDMIPGVQTINAGVPGYGLHQMQRWLEKRGMALKPDLVVCSLIFQDLNRAAIARIPDVKPLHITKSTKSRSPRHRPEQANETVPTKQEPAVVDVRNMLHSGLLTASDLYAYLRVKIEISTLNREMRERQRLIEQTRRAPGDVRGDTVWLAQIQAATGEIIDDFVSVLSHAEVPGMVVNISPFAIDWLEPVLEEQGIHYVDLSPALTGKDGISFEIDPHYNSRGHDVIAQGLAQAIVKRFGHRIRAEQTRGNS
jgi:lysophospholipase L1-like esterase